MPTYKLTYFNIRARAELTRLLFAVADAEYDDFRIDFKDWPVYKPKTPLGQLPLLEIDGTEYPQSLAINRHLARKFGLLGDSSIENLQCDVVADTCYSLRDPYLRNISLAHYKARGSEEVHNAKQKLLKEGIPKVMTALDTFLSEYGKDSGYIVGNKMTWADLALYDTVDAAIPFAPDVLSQYPKFAKHRQLVESNPKIRAYLRERPAAFS